jgi:hypothetical protein
MQTMPTGQIDKINFVKIIFRRGRQRQPSDHDEFPALTELRSLQSTVSESISEAASDEVAEAVVAEAVDFEDAPTVEDQGSIY